VERTYNLRIMFDNSIPIICEDLGEKKRYKNLKICL